MTVAGARVAAEPGPARAAEELRKIPAFVRRDFLVAWSYRTAFVSDLLNLTGQVLVFAFIGQMISPSELPRYGGTEVTYLEFASIGIALTVFVQFGLGRVGAALRGEQLMGTLESVLTTPTATATIQLGSVAFDLIYLPLRTAGFLAVTAALFGLHFSAAGLLPALLVVVAFIPFVWGLGIMSAALLLTVRRGAGAVGLLAILLGFTSGAYFPIDLLPGWVAATAAANPIALAIEGMRDALLGQATMSETLTTIAILAPLSLAALAVGLAAFRLALRRERRLGTLGLY
jgi:ABC-2 type transport system permease protein